MSYPVTYHCPRCETIVALERDGYLADKAVTPYPFEGWRYADPTEPFEDDAADGVRFACGDSDGVVWNPDEDDADGSQSGCGEPFYLSFVRYENGQEVDPRAESEFVTIDPDPRLSGPGTPDGPDGSGGFW